MTFQEDKHFEDFWYSLKMNMIKFYSTHEEYNEPCIKQVEEWSSTLNTLQMRREYSKIEQHINDYLSIFAQQVMRSKDIYQFHIMETNVKRWKTLRKSHSFMKTPTTMYDNIIYLCVDICKSIVKKIDKIEYTSHIDKFIDDLDIIIYYENYGKIIDIALLLETSSILDKLGKYINLEKLLYSLYGIKVPKRIKGKKLLEIIKAYTIEKEKLSIGIRSNKSSKVSIASKSPSPLPEPYYISTNIHTYNDRTE